MSRSEVIALTPWIVFGASLVVIGFRLREPRRALIDAQREELLRWRDAGRIPDAGLRIRERELSHEEQAFPSQEIH
jgi:hypothetical protein